MSEEKNKTGKVETHAVDSAAAFSRLARERGVVIYAGHIPVIVETLLASMEVLAAMSDFIAEAEDEKAVPKDLCVAAAREVLTLLGGLILAFGEARTSIERGNVVFLTFNEIGGNDELFPAKRAPETIH